MASTNSIKITSIKIVTTMKLIISNIILCTLISYLMLKADAYPQWTYDQIRQALLPFNASLQLLPEPPMGQHNPIYPLNSTDDEGGIFGSLNAGSATTFKITRSGGVNRNFEKRLLTVFKTAANLDTLSGLMLQAYNESQKSNQKFVCLSDVSALAMVDVVCGKALTKGTSTGTSVIVKFHPGISANPKSLFMVYAIGPGPSGDLEGFYKDLGFATDNLLTTVDELGKQTSDKIDVFRMCLLSGGIYRHPNATFEEIGTEIFTSIASYATREKHLPVGKFQFPYTPGFVDPWNHIFSSASVLRTAKVSSFATAIYALGLLITLFY